MVAAGPSSFLEPKVFFQAHAVAGKIQSLASVKTEVPILLLAVSQGSLSSPRGHPHVVLSQVLSQCNVLHLK